jgi:hypothetical protein
MSNRRNVSPTLSIDIAPSSTALSSLLTQVMASHDLRNAQCETAFFSLQIQERKRASDQMNDILSTISKMLTRMLCNLLERDMTAQISPTERVLLRCRYHRLRIVYGKFSLSKLCSLRMSAIPPLFSIPPWRPAFASVAASYCSLGSTHSLPGAVPCRTPNSVADWSRGNKSPENLGYFSVPSMLTAVVG